MQIDKILDKFGIYDLVAVLLSGICISTFSILTLQFIYEIQININSQVNETLLFFVISYFVGLVFQETGSLLYRIITHNDNRFLKSSLTPVHDSNIYLEDAEKIGVKLYIQEKLLNQSSSLKSIGNSDNIIYNYCKFYILANCDTTQIDKDQSISSMARSLSLYFALLALAIPIIDFAQLFIQSPAQLTIQSFKAKISLVIISIFLAILLCLRYLRFARLRYTKIVRFFYYTVVLNSTNISP